MANTVRTLTKEDQALAAVVLLNAGVKARIRSVRAGFRVVFVGSWQTVATALNEYGFKSAAMASFDRFAFNDTDPSHGEVFVRFMEA